MQKSEKKTKAYGDLLKDFANAKTPKEGATKLIKNIQKTFGFSSNFIKNEMAKLSDSNSLFFLSIVESEVKNLKECFTDFLEDRNLYNNSHFTSYYLADYNAGLLPRLLVEKDGSLSEETIFSERSFEIERETYKRVISYCVVTFFRYKRNRQLLNKCEVCNRFYILKKLMTKQKARFCSDDCRNKWHRSH